jgi:hypothetical protein
MKRLLLVVGLVACGHSSEDFPVMPGGHGPGGSTPGPDAAIDSGDGGAKLLGRVCLIGDPKLPTTGCADTGAGNLLVTLGLNTATTSDNGTFEIQATAATNAVWTVSGENIVPTVEPFTAQTLIPAVLATPFADLQNANGVLFMAGAGDVFVRVVQNSTPVAGATAIATGQQVYQSLYDPPSGQVWTTTATGTLGVAWLPGVPVGTQTVTVQPPATTAQITISNVPIVEGALTFVTADVF